MQPIALTEVIEYVLQFALHGVCLVLYVCAFKMVRNTTLNGHRRWLVYSIAGTSIALVSKIYVTLPRFGMPSSPFFMSYLLHIASVGQVLLAICAMSIFRKMIKTSIDQMRYANAGLETAYRYEAPSSPGVWPPPPA